MPSGDRLIKFEYSTGVYVKVEVGVEVKVEMPWVWLRDVGQAVV